MRLLSIADVPSDDDDTRLRKRVGVAAGVATIVAPLTLPLQAPGQPLAVAFGVALSLYSVSNLALLLRTHKFERYVVALIASGVVFVPVGTFLGGGITGSSVGIVWAFLMPAYAIMALGPRRGRDDVEEIVAETFARAFAAWRSGQGPAGRPLP